MECGARALLPFNMRTEGTKINLGLTVAEEPREEESGFQAVVAPAGENDVSWGHPHHCQDTCPAPSLLRPALEPPKGPLPKALAFSESRLG